MLGKTCFGTSFWGRSSPDESGMASSESAGRKLMSSVLNFSIVLMEVAAHAAAQRGDHHYRRTACHRSSSLVLASQAVIGMARTSLEDDHRRLGRPSGTGGHAGTLGLCVVSLLRRWLFSPSPHAQKGRPRRQRWPPPISAAQTSRQRQLRLRKEQGRKSGELPSTPRLRRASILPRQQRKTFGMRGVTMTGTGRWWRPIQRRWPHFS